MKKLVLAFAAIVAVSFASCGGNTEAADAVDSDSIAEAVDTAAVDTAAADTTAADSVK